MFFFLAQALISLAVVSGTVMVVASSQQGSFATHLPLQQLLPLVYAQPKSSLVKDALCVVPYNRRGTLSQQIPQLFEHLDRVIPRAGVAFSVASSSSSAATIGMQKFEVYEEEWEEAISGETFVPARVIDAPTLVDPMRYEALLAEEGHSDVDDVEATSVDSNEENDWLPIDCGISNKPAQLFSVVLTASSREAKTRKNYRKQGDCHTTSVARNDRSRRNKPSNSNCLVAPAVYMDMNLANMFDEPAVCPAVPVTVHLDSPTADVNFDWGTMFDEPAVCPTVPVTVHSDSPTVDVNFDWGTMFDEPAVCLTVPLVVPQSPGAANNSSLIFAKARLALANWARLEKLKKEKAEWEEVRAEARDNFIHSYDASYQKIVAAAFDYIGFTNQWNVSVAAAKAAHEAGITQAFTAMVADETSAHQQIMSDFAAPEAQLQLNWNVSVAAAKAAHEARCAGLLTEHDASQAQKRANIEAEQDTAAVEFASIRQKLDAMAIAQTEARRLLLGKAFNIDYLKFTEMNAIRDVYRRFGDVKSLIERRELEAQWLKGQNAELSALMAERMGLLVEMEVQQRDGLAAAETSVAEEFVSVRKKLDLLAYEAQITQAFTAMVIDESLARQQIMSDVAVFLAQWQLDCIELRRLKVPDISGLKKVLISSVSILASRDDEGTHRGGVVDSQEDEGTHRGSVVDSQEDEGTHRGSVVASQEDEGTHRGSVVASQEDEGTHRGNVVASQEDEGTHRGNVVVSQEDEGTHRGNVVASQEDEADTKSTAINSKSKDSNFTITNIQNLPHLPVTIEALLDEHMACFGCLDPLEDGFSRSVSSCFDEETDSRQPSPARSAHGSVEAASSSPRHKEKENVLDRPLAASPGRVFGSPVRVNTTPHQSPSKKQAGGDGDASQRVKPEGFPGVRLNFDTMDLIEPQHHVLGGGSPGLHKSDPSSKTIDTPRQVHTPRTGAGIVREELSDLDPVVPVESPIPQSGLIRRALNFTGGIFGGNKKKKPEPKVVPPLSARSRKPMVDDQKPWH